MVMAMKIEKQATKSIKPFVETLPILSPYKLGFMDEFAPFHDVGIVLFFAAAKSSPNLVVVERLENSLAKTLTRFYPLAGRCVEETHSIDCNDHGVEFTYATIDTKLQDFLHVSKENVNLIDEFIPSKTGRGLLQSDPLLATQVTTFECGGVAIGVTATHKIVDASTLCTVINEWAVLNREDEIEFKGSGFNSSVLLPARGLSPHPVPPVNDDALSKYTRKKVSFSESEISKMKAKGTKKNHRWSKVQVVSAILWKTLMEVDLVIHNRPRESLLIQIANLRGRMGFSIPKDSCGNLWGFFATECKKAEETVEELTDRLSDSVKKILTDFSKGKREEGEEMVLNLISNITANIGESTHFVTPTSWCKFPFYEADFGFGKPVWIAPGMPPLSFVAPILMDDAQGNGVEAYLFLEVKQVPYFEEALQHVKAAFAA